MRAIDGVEVRLLGGAFQQACYSEGVTIRQLAQDSEVSGRIISGWFEPVPKAISDPKIRTLIKTLHESAQSGVPLDTPQRIMTYAGLFPKIDKHSATDAIVIEQRYLGISHKEIERRKRSFMPTEISANSGRAIRAAELEAEYYIARAIGYISLGAMVKKALSRPKEVPDRYLVPAVEALREAKHIPKKTFAELLGLSEDGYHYSLRNCSFSVRVRSMLMPALGLSKHLPQSTILDEVNKLEELPDRKAFGEAVRKVRQHKGITMKRLAELIHCNPETLARIEHGEDGEGAPASSWLRLIPRQIGCDDMHHVITESQGKRLLSRVRMDVRTRVIYHGDEDSVGDSSYVAAMLAKLAHAKSKGPDKS